MLNSAPVKVAITGSVTILRLLVVRFLALLCLAAIPDAVMAQAVPTSEPPAKIVQEWNRSLSSVDRYLKQPSYTEAKTKQLRARRERSRADTTHF